jgi:hypothetical protein
MGERLSSTGVRRPRTATIRHPYRGRMARLGLWIKERWDQLLGLHVLWLVLYLALGAWCLLPSGTFFQPAEVGAIAARDYVAPRDLLVPDEEATRGKRQRAREEVLPVYDFDSGALVERELALSRFFAEGRRLAAREDRPAPADVAAELQKVTNLRLSPEQAAALIEEGFSPALRDRLIAAFREILTRGVVADEEALLEHRAGGISLRNLETGAEDVQLDLYDYLEYPDEVGEQAQEELRVVSGFSAGQRQQLLDFLVANLAPNVYPNRSETLARQMAAETAAAPVFNQVRKGQMLVRKGDEITAGQARAIAVVRGDRSPPARILPVLGGFLALGLGALVLWFGLSREKVEEKTRRQLFGESLLILLAGLLLARFGFFAASALASALETAPFNSLRSYLYALPFASLALVTGLLYGRAPALLISVVFSLLVGRLAGAEGGWAIIYALAGSLAAIYAVDRYHFKERSVMLRVGVMVGAVNVAVILMLAAVGGELLQEGLARLAFDLGCGFLGGLLCAAAGSFAVPILESLLGITTDIKLVELANTNLPLLRRLAFEAPGTFQHSLMVANLAKAGCEAIGADSVLAYTGALYHDIGKVFRPEYFIENQRQGVNLHDKLTPSMSTLVLISHVKDGVDLVRQYHLPKVIQDAVEQHHGTRLITYFYSRALELADPITQEVREEKYRYPGPKPRNKVQGVLMLADGVEAASRTLVEANPVKLRSVIRAIVEDCLQDGQLDDTDLTLSDISRVGEAFLRLLANLFHRRIDYPGFDFNLERKERSPSRVSEIARVS